MARNINIEEQVFPVWEQPVYLEKGAKLILGYKAIVGNPSNDLQKVFSVVSENYKLISNKDAINMGKLIHKKLFPNASDASFEIFNVIAPASKSFCQIDIIDKNYEFNIWKKELYVPFIRIHNSYNKSRSLQFDIGFCRKLCDNGVIYEQDVVKLKFAHTKQSIKLDGIESIDVSHLKKLEQQFVSRLTNSREIQVPQKYFLRLAAKTLNRSFNFNESDPKKKGNIDLKFLEFKSIIDKLSYKYIVDEEMGETAYAFYNVITDFASNNTKLQASAVNGLQSKCGLWVNEVGELVSKPGFNWEEELQDYAYLNI